MKRSGSRGIDWGDDGNVVFTLNQGRGCIAFPRPGVSPSPFWSRTRGCGTPRLLPGGEAVIFTDLSTFSTHFLDLRTDSVHLVRAGAIDAVYVQTGHLLFADAAGTLWAAAFDPGQGVIRGEPVTVFDGLTKPQNQYARFSVSRNGTLVYGAGLSVATGSGHRLVIVDLEGNADVLVLSPRNLADVRWSPDGRSVAYRSATQVDTSPNIFTYDVELETTPRQLTFEGLNVRPVFSPDGTQVAFASTREESDDFDLFVKRLDDDAPARSLIRLPGDQFPTQWPSETLIVFEEGLDPSDLWVLDLSDPDTPRAEVYLPLEADLDGIVVSRDGSLAAYQSNETGTDEIYIRSFPEPGERTPVSRGGGFVPRWAPDSNTVYFWAPARNIAGATLWAARIRREPTPVVLSRDSLLSGPYEALDFDLHPDGDRFVVPQNVSTDASPRGASEAERFIVVTNWFEELRRRMGSP